MNKKATDYQPGESVLVGNLKFTKRSNVVPQTETTPEESEVWTDEQDMEHVPTLGFIQGHSTPAFIPVGFTCD